VVSIRIVRVLSVDAGHPDVRDIAEAAAALRAGKLVVFPTETVYGLGARALDIAAVKRVFEVKGRPPTHPLIIHLGSAKDAMGFAASWPPAAAELAAAFWPGPLTLVVEKADFVPSEVTGGGTAVALRVPSHPVARALISALGDHEAIVAPSANRFQSISPTRAEHVIASLGGVQAAQDVLILDGGPCPSGIESTVVDVRDGEPRILRPGALTIPALRAVSPSMQPPPIGDVADDHTRPSPGMGKRHYAPTTPLELAKDRASVLARAAELTAAGERVCGVLFRDPLRSDEQDPGAPLHVLPQDIEATAAALYALLHELDRQKYVRIVVEPPPSEPGWEAIADRLRRAAAR
jgi:L-threonylcarbamoyladenylate synthase